MRKFILLSSLLVLLLSATKQKQMPDLTKKEDLIELGIGRIIEKDNSIIKKIKLHEVKEYWIVYIKDNSLHDLMMDKIDCLEFPDSKWGFVRIEFPENKPQTTLLAYGEK